MLAKGRLISFYLLFFLLISSQAVAANAGPRVPAQMDFAGMKLKISDAARSDIQQQVDALRASERYFRLRLDLVLLYFPLIEKVMKEEGLPDDIKYLVIQESGLVSDAVSSANAVGFWMFKEPAGREVGLRIDKYVDERLNIVASTQGACKYIKRHNFFFKNWVYSVIAHNTGRTGAEKHVDRSNFGASKMTIDKDTHWYFKTFLAHMIAFQGELGGKPTNGLELKEYKNGAGKTLDKIAKDVKADEELVFQYNKWLKRGPVPSEKEYSVIIPTRGGEKVQLIAREEKKSPEETQETSDQDITGAEEATVEDRYPDLKSEIDKRIASFVIDINGIPALVAGKGDDLKTLEKKSGISSEKIIKYNELKPKQEIEAGQVYYLKSKKAKSKIYYHTTRKGETLWAVSQEYGIKVKLLAQKNRMFTIDVPEEGRVLWLRKKRPATVPVEIKSDVGRKEVIADTDSGAPKKPAINVVPEAVENEIAEEEVLNKETQYGEEVGREENQYSNDEAAVEQPVKPADSEARIIAPDETKKTESLEVHIVQRGETLYSIARKYGVTFDELKKWNGIGQNNLLSVGQELHLAKRDTTNTKEVVNPAVHQNPKVSIHVVVSGDTMYSISRKYGVSVESLLKWNDKTNFVLSLGEKLKVSE